MTTANPVTLVESLPGSLNEALAHAVAQWPDKPFLRIEGLVISYAEFEERVARLAGGLQAAGLRRGDRLLVLMRNSLACPESWFAANRIGALWAPINTEFRGQALEHVCAVADAQLAIVDADLVELLQGALDARGLQPATYVHGAAVGELPRVADLYRHEPVPAVRAHFADASSLLFTSGTTGRSKACVLSHRYFLSQGAILNRDVGLQSDDVLFCPFPFFHADATALTTVPALLLGATAAFAPRFSASKFWSQIAEHQATVFDFMGATLAILYKAEQRSDDAENTVRVAWGVPLPDWASDFESRFGLDLVTMYGSVEANICVTQPPTVPRIPGSCGRATAEFSVELHDDDGNVVPAGQEGEFVIRPRHPSIMLDGYFGMPEATIETCRNLWFHSGDTGRMDEHGNLFFIGRVKEAIRRRGENISAFEVEEGLLLHHDIVECAAIGVPSELTEEDVKVCIVRRPGSELGFEDVIAHADRSLARFQVPRFVEFVDDIPKTPTGKLEKYKLRENARNPHTYDREAMTA